MSFIGFGNLGKAYSNEIKSIVKDDKAIEQQKKDNQALAKSLEKRRAQRERRMKARDLNHVNPHQEMKNLEENPLEVDEIKQVVAEAKSKTNVLARQHGLVQPNNPEALQHDRLHCFACDRKLHNPNAHEGEGLGGLFDDSEVRILCCWCFGRFGDEKIKTMMEKTGCADKQIRLAVYDPVEFCREEIEYLTDMKRIQLKSKIKQYDGLLVGKVKHDLLEESDWFENFAMHTAKTRYTASNG